MTKSAWKAYVAARDRYRDAVERWSRAVPDLPATQGRLAEEREGGSYPVETSVVYNRDLDAVGADDDIRVVIVADNPGRREQAAENRRYLVGPSGKLAERFFREHPELGLDFRAQALVLNKTPVHTARTAELRRLAELGGPAVAALLDESQRFCARFAKEVHCALKPEWGLWIIGYSELKKGGLFESFSRELREAYRDDPEDFDQVLLFRHFSMNQFSIDFRAKSLAGEDARRTLLRVGREYRERMLR